MKRKRDEFFDITEPNHLLVHTNEVIAKQLIHMISLLFSFGSVYLVSISYRLIKTV